MRFSLLSITAVLAISSATFYSVQATPVKFRRDGHHGKDWSTSCHPVNFTDIVVFGDSYVDNGNTYKLTDQSWPDSEYFEGRFCDGYVWPEYVAKDKNYHQANFAYDGATSDNRLVQGYTGRDVDVPVPGFWQQIQHFVDHHHGDDDNDDHHDNDGHHDNDDHHDDDDHHDMDSHEDDDHHDDHDDKDKKSLENTLFALHFQGYDFRFEHHLEVAEVVKRYEHGLRWLIELGAKHIFVIGGVDISKVPYVLSQPEKDREEMQKVALELQDGVKKVVWQLQSEYGRPASDEKPFQWCPADYEYLYDHTHSERKTFDHHVNVAWIDTEAVLESVRTTPATLEQLNITVLDKGCYDEKEHTVCSNPEEYFYWDGLHPSTKIHKAFSAVIQGYL